MEDVALYQRAFERERAARKAAEQLLEKKAAELFQANQALQHLNLNLEATVESRTSELSKANARLGALVSNLNSGLLAEDELRRIILINQKFCEIFSIPSSTDEMIGLDCSGFAAQGKEMFEDPDGFLTRIEQCLKERVLVIADQLKTVDGRILERDYIPILEEGHYRGHLWQYRDVTPRVEAENELRAARQIAEAAGEARELFFANMSHEIRTPMNSILGMSELLLKDELPEKQRHYLSIINDSASSLLVVINDILDFSKVNAGKLQLEHIGFKLAEVVRKMVATVEDSAQQKRLELIVELDPLLPEVLIGDPFRITQVLLNLFSNGIKFTDRGFVKLSIKVDARDEDQIRLRFEVRDSGIGISEKKLETIFDGFTQEDASITRKFGGTGLGLTISAKLVSLMGGKIKVESEPDRGATFSFGIDTTIGSLKDLPSTSVEHQNIGSLAGLKLLLVEDHPYNQQLALSVMEEWDVEVDLAENGLIALEFMEQNRYDCVLMDVQMPVMDGIEATRQIRLRYGARQPVIALTANALRSQELSLREGQMDGYVSKPFRAETLRQEILRVLQLAKEMETEDVSAQPKLDELYDRATLERQTGGDPAMTKRMLDLFIEMTPPILDDLQAAIAERDLRKLENMAHKLKPSVRLMGMQRILNPTLDLEKATEKGLSAEQAISLAEKLIQHLSATLQAIKLEG